MGRMLHSVKRDRYVLVGNRVDLFGNDLAGRKRRLDEPTAGRD